MVIALLLDSMGRPFIIEGGVTVSVLGGTSCHAHEILLNLTALEASSKGVG